MGERKKRATRARKYPAEFEESLTAPSRSKKKITTFVWRVQLRVVDARERKYMGPLNRFFSFFDVVDLNRRSKTMGVKGKKHKFASDLDIFAKETERIKSKAYIWTSIKLPKKIHKGSNFFFLITRFNGSN